METAANKTKVTHRLYSVDEGVLKESTAALGQLAPKLDIDRSDVMCALIHLTPEIDLEALGILRSRYERAGGALPADDKCDRPLTLRLLTEDVEKIKAVAKRVKARKVPSSEGELIRAVAHVKLDWALFLPKLTVYLTEFPDGRELRWKSS
jgi:hypothetical protein